MQRALVLAVVLIVVLAVQAAAEDPRILEIRRQYNAVSELAGREDEHSGDGALTHTLSYRNIMPGTGYRNRVVSYFHEDTPHPEGRVGELGQSLRKVTLEDNISAVRFHREYLYSPEGDLLFCFLREEGFPGGEKRFYFYGGELIRVVIEPLGNGADERFAPFQGDGSFPPRIVEEAAAVARAAEEHHGVFRFLVKHQFID